MSLSEKRFLKSSLKAVVGVVLIGLIALVVMSFLNRGSHDAPSFGTVEVKRGDLLVTISATGTVEPEQVVDVGAQVAGKIVAFGKDKSGKTVDYGAIVEEGMVLAKIDDALYNADVVQARSQLSQARAGQQRAEADLWQFMAKMAQSERDWGRANKLGPSEALSQSDYDTALSVYEISRANVGVGKAALAQSKEIVAQAESTLKRSLQNLAYCTIKSPVSGVIIDRRVNIGQTVVASLSAPSLFLIAKDLKHLQIWVSVNEADIVQVKPGQPVSFKVDAFPGQVFQGEVKKVRLNAAMTQNVVTYTVEVTTENSDGRLFPYLTANVKFLVNERRNVLVVPNAALRWTPPPDQVVAPNPDEATKAAIAESLSGKGAPIPPDRSGKPLGKVWVPDGRFVRPVAVRVGLSDGANTEVQSEELSEGTAVVLSMSQKDAGSLNSLTNPFTPQFNKRSTTKAGQ